jgi:putative SOS response-associated peptidase YedK
LELARPRPEARVHRSEGREFTTGRCLIIAAGFYEFTDPKDPKKKLFSPVRPILAIGQVPI